MGKRTQDEEMLVIGRVIRQLEGLDPEARVRAVNYLSARNWEVKKEGPTQADLPGIG